MDATRTSARLKPTIDRRTATVTKINWNSTSTATKKKNRSKRKTSVVPYLEQWKSTKFQSLRLEETSLNGITARGPCWDRSS